MRHNKQPGPLAAHRPKRRPTVAKSHESARGANAPQTGKVGENPRAHAADTAFAQGSEPALLKSLNTPAWRYLLDTANNLMARLDSQLRFSFANPLVSQYFSCTAATAPGLPIARAGASAKAVSFFRKHVGEAFRTGELRVATASLPMRHGEVTGEFHFVPEFNEDGTVASVVFRMIDITEKVRLERELDLAQERVNILHRLTRMHEAPEEEALHFALEEIRHLTYSEHSYIYLPKFGPDGRNRMLWSKSLYSVVPDHALPNDRLPESCVPRQQLDSPALQPQITNTRTGAPLRMALGSLPIYRGMFVPIFEEGRLVAVIAVCNKSSDYEEVELKQMELFARGMWLILRRHDYVDSLKKAKEHAERANKVKDEFLANISHELRTPLNGILSMLHLLEQSGMSEEQSIYTRNAELSGQALLRIISDILDFSRLQSGKMKLNNHPFSVRDVLASTVDLFAIEAGNRNIRLVLAVDEALPPLVTGDDARLRQILFNLVGNALKFTSQGTITIECSRLPYSKNGNVWIYLAVRDTGIGIAEEFHDLIFDPFIQLDGSHSRRYSGTGLGLGIVRRLADSMGGSVTVESAPAQGTTFHCSLRLPGTTAMREAPAWSPAKDAVDVPCLDILMAEDDPVNQFGLRAALTRSGHRVVCVSNGLQALEALIAYPFHCLITDIQMPVMDGLEAVRRIRSGDTAGIRPSQTVLDLVRQNIPTAGQFLAAIPEALPIVAITAHAMSGDKERFLNEGIDLYLSKPISIQELSETLKIVYSRLYQAGAEQKDRPPQTITTN